MGEEEIAAFARAYSAIAEARLDFQFALADPANKTVEAQNRLREAMRERTSEIVNEQGLTDEDYIAITYLVSTSQDHRNAFEAALAELERTGSPGRE